MILSDQPKSMIMTLPADPSWHFSSTAGQYDRRRGTYLLLAHLLEFSIH